MISEKTKRISQSTRNRNNGNVKPKRVIMQSDLKKLTYGDRVIVDNIAFAYRGNSEGKGHELVEKSGMLILSNKYDFVNGRLVKIDGTFDHYQAQRNAKDYEDSRQALQKAGLWEILS
jgi:hypothetical protein